MHNNNDHNSAFAPPFDVKVQHLSVDVRVAKKEHKTLLDDISFRIRPGTMTLILGAPGCGKTLLFKALAHQLSKPYKVHGNLLFNEKPPHRKTHHSSVAYVTQEDIHFPTLTVRETLKFSIDCQSALSEESKNKKIDEILRMLDLSHVQNTIVGNDLIRGISGGQRKRVTIGVSLTTGPSIVLLDEPTTGLDANTSLEILKSMRNTCDSSRIPVVAALLQPSPEICSLFDNLLILSGGKVAYFGSYKNAVNYFAAAGLVGHRFQSDPEFLQEAAEYPYKYAQSANAPQSPVDTVALYRNSQEFADAEAAAAEPRIMSEASALALAAAPAATATPVVDDLSEGDHDDDHTYPISFWRQARLNMKREAMMLNRDRTTLISRVIKKAIMSLIIGSLFYDLPHGQNGLRTRQGVCFFLQLFLAFGNLGALQSFYTDKRVFYTQRDAKYYSPAAYFLAKTTLELPIIIVESFVFGTITYWMVGLNPEAGRYFYAILMLVVVSLFAISFCRFVSASVPSEQVAHSIVPAVYGFMVLYAGFIIIPPSIPDWWIWLYYLSTFHYGLEGLLVNEFVGSTYHCSAYETQPPQSDPRYFEPYPFGYEGNSVCPVTSGSQQLRNWDMHDEMYWRWIHVAIVFGYVLVIMAFTLRALSKKPATTRAYQPMAEADGIKLSVKEKEVTEKDASYGAYMSWEKLSYAVDVKEKGKSERRVLLNSISGYVRPGMLMALMGPSGAGKSTLLDVLANRKTGGHTDGTILINGKPRDQYFNRFTGYIEQQDILMPLSTVRETLSFSAENRLPRSTTREERYKEVDKVMGILELTPLQATYAQNLTMEQKKRLTIGVELVANPQLLFLDEPTSGLDSQAATKVMDIVKRIAATGRSVICTIHQPSSAVFTCFDHVLLLKRGGETIYFGPTGKDCVDLLTYFENIGWHCEEKRNPADFILDVAAATIDESTLTSSSPSVGSGKGADISSGVPKVDLDRSGDIEFEKQKSRGQQPRDPARAYADSELRQTMEGKLNDMPGDYSTPTFHGRYSSSIRVQIKTNLKRTLATTLRRRENIRARVMRFLVTGILLGTTYLQVDNDQEGLLSRFSAFFYVCITLATGVNVLVPTLVSERAVFYREQATGMYHTIAYYIAVLVSEMPMTFVTVCIFVIPTYWLIGFQSGADHFFFYLWICLLYAYLQALLVITISMAMPNIEMAVAMVGLSVSVFSLFAGFMITKPDIPDYWIWLYYISTMHYPLEAMFINELKDMKFECPNNKGAVSVYIEGQGVSKFYCPFESGDQFLDVFSMGGDDKYVMMAAALVYISGLFVLCYLALRFIRHLKR